MMYDIIIVGGGPGGIAAAVEAYIFGMKNILMIEKGGNHSQTIRMYYKDSKRVDKVYNKQEIDLKGNVEFFDGTKESTLDHFETMLSNELINTLYQTEVDRVVKEDDVFKVVTPKGDYFGKKVIVGIGRMGRPNKPSYKIPRGIRKMVNHNIYDCKGGEKILVVGAGDSGVEYACQLTTENDVTIVNRRDEFQHPNDINKEMILRYDKEERLKVLYNTDIESLEEDEKGIKVNFTNGSHIIYDRIILAIGGTTPIDFLRKSNIDVDEGKNPKFDENYETNVKGLYIVGDIIFKKGGSIAMAINHSFDALKHITEGNK